MFVQAFRSSIAASLICVASALPAQSAQSYIAERVDQVLRGTDRGHFIGQVAVSPDGKRLAWIQGARGGSEIRLAPIDDLSKSTRITAAASADQHCRENDLAWTPDSAALAF